jgi:hypothetical protein
VPLLGEHVVQEVAEVSLGRNVGPHGYGYAGDSRLTQRLRLVIVLFTLRTKSILLNIAILSFLLLLDKVIF